MSGRMGGSGGIAVFILILSLVFLLHGCSLPTTGGGRPSPRLVRMSWDVISPELDDGDREGLEEAVVRSLWALEQNGALEQTKPANGQVSTARVRATLRLFRKLLRHGRLDRATLSRAFELLAYSEDGSTPMELLLTGYYEPVLDARLRPDDRYRYPIYGPPDDLIQVALERFQWARLSGSGPRRIVGRLEGRQLVPYYSRKEIDGAGILEGRGLEIAWLKDPLDVFFLHVQGSGVLRFPDGTFRRVGYAGSNGHPYRSIGAYLVERGWMKKDAVSLQSLRAFFEAHPERIAEVLWSNPSYVFFRWTDEGPLGSLGVPLTPLRSVAADSLYYPRGVLGFLTGVLPGDGNGKARPFHRWVVHQDSGGAIRGPRRLDLFCGTGKEAETIAGRLKHPARFFIVLKKDRSSVDIHSKRVVSSMRR